LLVFYCVFATAEPAEEKPSLIGVLISQEIRPFVQMVEGLEENLDIPVCRIFLDKNNGPYSPDPCFKRLDPENFPVLVAVGPRALSYLTARNWPSPVAYGMVLNPDRFVGNRDTYCGVSLNFNLWEQVYTITKTFPDVRKLGVLFDPANNQKWFNSARSLMVLKGIMLVPLSVSERSEILKIVKAAGPRVDAILFIPDKTVISRTIIQHVIKEAIKIGIPTVGYNRFFHESGAALSFLIDYRWVGEQVAGQVSALIEGQPCSSFGPRNQAMLNRNVVRTLGVRLATHLPPEVLEGN
jgi:putative ABC transport system substrate-binding protein